MRVAKGILRSISLLFDNKMEVLYVRLALYKSGQHSLTFSRKAQYL